MAQTQFQIDYTLLSVTQKNEILSRYPLKLSEADPFVTNS